MLPPDRKEILQSSTANRHCTFGHLHTSLSYSLSLSLLILRITPKLCPPSSASSSPTAPKRASSRPSGMNSNRPRTRLSSGVLLFLVYVSFLLGALSCLALIALIWDDGSFTDHVRLGRCCVLPSGLWRIPSSSVSFVESSQVKFSRAMSSGVVLLPIRSVVWSMYIHTTCGYDYDSQKNHDQTGPWKEILRNRIPYTNTKKYVN